MLDAYNHPVAGFTGTLTFTSSDPTATFWDATTGAVLMGNAYTFNAADHGTHAFTVALQTAGNQTIAIAGTADGPPAGSTTLMVNPASAAQFVLRAPTSVVAGTRFDITVTVLDAYGNVVTGYAGIVSFTSSDPAPGVVLPPDYTFTTGPGGDNGVYTFSGGVVLFTLGDQTLAVTDTVSGLVGGSVVTVAGGGGAALPPGVGEGQLLGPSTAPERMPVARVQPTPHVALVDRFSARSTRG